MRRIALLGLVGLCLVFPHLVFAEAPIAGQWHNSQHQVAMYLLPDGQYLFVYSNGTRVSGQWVSQNGSLAMNDPGTGQTMVYAIQSLDEKNLNLVDVRGAPLSFVRQGGSAPAVSRGKDPLEQGIQTYIRFVQFLINQPLPQADQARIRKEATSLYEQKPADFTAEANQISANMSRAYQLTDPIQIGLVRQALMSSLFAERQNNPRLNQTALIQVMDRHAPILVYDPTTGLVLTQNDLEGILGYVEFIQGLNHPGFTLAPEDRAALTKQITTYFVALPLDQKQAYVTASLAHEWLQNNWESMTPLQQRQFAANLLQQGGYTDGYGHGYSQTPQYERYEDPFAQGVAQAQHAAKQTMSQASQYQGGCPQCLNIMQNMNTQSHATALNIIENIGGTGNYWEVKPSWQNW